jgi:biopolymer transport protein ExbB/TolQ
MKISENTSVTTDLKFLITIIVVVGMSVWGYFSITERLNKLETADQLMENDLLKKADQIPTDKEQFFLLEALAEKTEKQQKILEENLHVKVMLMQAEKEIEKLKKDVEKLKDVQRDIKFSNGNGNGH